VRVALFLFICAVLSAIALASCSGGSSAIAPPGLTQSTPTPTPTPTPPPAPTPTVLVLRTGQVTGSDNQFSPIDGDTPSGGSGQTIDGIKCEPMVATYHVHAHLSLFVNGVRLAIPDAIGIVSPGAESNGYVASGSCFYHLHTHDADGYVHIEAPVTTAFTLGQFFDIWGQPLTTSNVAGFTGSTAFYTAQGPTGYNTIAGEFVQYTGDPRNIALTSHEEITLEVGPILISPPYVPAVQFYTQF
jgi:hypothetical protein